MLGVIVSEEGPTNRDREARSEVKHEFIRHIFGDDMVILVEDRLHGVPD